jgi:hypothetical protein
MVFYKNGKFLITSDDLVNSARQRRRHHGYPDSQRNALDQAQDIADKRLHTND